MSDLSELLADEIRAVFADDELAVPLAAIERGLARRRRGRALAAAAAGVLTVGAVTAGVVTGAHLAGQRAAAERAAAVQRDRAAFDAGCRASWRTSDWDEFRQANRLTRDLPPLVLSLADGTPGVRVYATGLASIVCLRASDGTVRVSSAGSNVFGPVNEISGGYEYAVTGPGSSPNTLSYLVGPARSGVTQVDLRLASGTVVHAKLGGGYFGYADSQGRLADAQVVIGTVAGTYVNAPATVAPASVESLQRSCPGRIQDMLRNAPDLTAAQRAQEPTLLFTDEALPDLVYATDQAIIECLAGLDAWFPGVPFSQQAGELSIVLYNPSLRHGLVYGHSPAGTERVEVVLTDGSRVTATLTNGFYHAAWPGIQLVQKVLAYTPTTVYTRENATTTTEPR
ncbi:MAG TPA: hypothetical protein VH561_11260 [Micromonosporaceae bacterium]|jgi:hypothetical protein